MSLPTFTTINDAFIYSAPATDYNNNDAFLDTIIAQLLLENTIIFQCIALAPSSGRSLILLANLYRNEDTGRVSFNTIFRDSTCKCVLKHTDAQLTQRTDDIVQNGQPLSSDSSQFCIFKQITDPSYSSWYVYICTTASNPQGIKIFLSRDSPV